MSETKYLATATAGLWLPLGQSVVTGALAGSVSGSLAALAHADQPGTIGLLAGGVVAAGFWFGALNWWRSAIKEPPPAPALAYPAETVRLEVMGNPDSNYPWGMFVDLNLSGDLLRWALEQLAAGADLSMSSLTGPGRLSRSEYCELRDGLIRAGLAYWRNERAHSQGCAMNRAGARVVDRYVDALALRSVNPPPGAQMALKPAKTPA